MSTSIPAKITQRKLYQALMAFAFSLDCGHRHYYILRFMVHLYFLDWLIMVIISPIYVIIGKKDLDISFIIELIQYILAGLMNCLVFLVFILKNEQIESNYICIQTYFYQWSKRRFMDPEKAYRKSSQTIRSLVVPIILVTSLILFGPFLAAVNDLGKVPLDSQPHFVLFWPKFVEIKTFSIYAIIYTIQFTFSAILLMAVTLFNFGLIIFLNEMHNQYEMLLDGIKDAFDYRMDEEFKIRFIDCIRHHQIIIKFLDDFKSYFQWVMLIETFILQGILTIFVFNLTQSEASIGYKLKLFGGLVFTSYPYYFHCQMGEDILAMHKRLADHIYNMTWYEMPNKHKQLIVIMYQRTQRELSLKSALFTSDKASRLLITRMVKQVYTLSSLLLKS